MEEGKGIDRQSKVDLMTAAAGAIGRLLPKLGEFLKEEHNLQTSTPMKKDLLESLEIHLRRVEDALVVRMMPRAQQDQVVVDPQEGKHCAYELGELAYDIEDIVDNLMLHIDKGKQVTQQPIINQDSFSRETLDNIKVLIENLAAWRAANFVPTTTTSTVEPCLDDGFKQVRHLVGIHRFKAELISRMSSSSQGLKIVSIWGAGGMGKTTLAKAVYKNIQGNFQYTAFVSLGPQPEMKKALRDILKHLDKRKYRDIDITILDAQQLTNELRHFLENKRFLIVVDDIREIPSWEVFKVALVDNGCGSRIITTSRVLGVAESSGEVLKLKPLSINGSKELFYATLLCGRKGTINLDPLDEQTTKYILKKCGYVPLAIIMIASLLAGKPQEEWTEVCNSIGFGQEDNIGGDENNTRKIIQFSYYDLPSHLKTCLLYLSIFPDDHVIKKDTLVWRWVAEGFVHDDGEQGESLFKVGERYLHELVSRSMIQAVGYEDTNIRGCRVEGMVRDWIRTVAKQENFVTVSGDWYAQDQHESNNARIMAIHNRVVDKPHALAARIWKPKVRSFNGTDCSISSTTLLHTTSQVLRVLSLEGCKLTTDGSSDGLKNLIAGLLHLRYLGLHGTNIWDLPMEIGDLKFLQTLDLTDTNIHVLPHSVTLLRQLKCLRCFTSRRLKSPEGMGNLTSLEELWLGKIHDSPKLLTKKLSKLTELRVLRIDMVYYLSRKQSEAALVRSLSKLQKIEVLELCIGRKISIVNFKKKCMSWERLPVLIAPGAFPKLRYMKMDNWLISQPGAMPRLKAVELEVHVQALKDAKFDFHKLSYLRLLEKVHVGINCWRAKIKDAVDAEAALRHAVESHPNRPKLILNRVGRCVDEKQIRSFGGLHGSGLLAPQVMPLELLREITNDFSEEQRLGSGTFGTVYKGDLDGKEVAVKLLHSTGPRLDYEKDFMKEFENLSRLNHANIVQLLGYCYEIKRICVEHKGKHVLADITDRALCFYYMQNGSLQRHLDDESRGLDWQTRYKIIKGTCEGLKYLHKGLEKPMFHLDLKPDNILLDENMAPKLADFGLSKLVSDNQTRPTSSFLGTCGYCPPEHIDRYYFSDKFDIFSLGVIMIEIISGPKSYGKAVEMGSQGFIDHVQENWIKRIHQATADCTSPKCECLQVKRCIEIALECVNTDRLQRPDIEDIISRLNETETILRNKDQEQVVMSRSLMKNGEGKGTNAEGHSKGETPVDSDAGWRNDKTLDKEKRLESPESLPHKELGEVGKGALVDDTLVSKPQLENSSDVSMMDMETSWVIPDQRHCVESDCQIVGNKFLSLLNEESHHSKWEEFRKLAREGVLEECNTLLKRMELVDSAKEDDLLDDDVDEEFEVEEKISLLEANILMGDPDDEEPKRKRKRKTKTTR